MRQASSAHAAPSALLTYGLLLLAFIGLLYMSVFAPGTGGDGDSVMHYLFAYWGFQHPELLLDHWAKPLFTILAAPFAQLGFEGIKLFNVLAALGSAWLTWRTAAALKMQNSAFGTVYVLAVPLLLTLTCSGLTEPLFAFWLILSIYFAARERFLLSALLISLLPFVRSEGLIFLGVFATYFVVKRQYKVLPWLLAGHLLFGLIGWPVYGTPLWPFTANPYVGVESGYGEGQLSDFIFKFYYALGLPAFLLLMPGLLRAVGWLAKLRSKSELGVLVFLGFGGFFVAQSVLWGFGLFHSMGLARVVVGVIPLMALIALAGVNWLQPLLERVSPWLWKGCSVLMIGYL